jgi:hypothetical protein
MLCGSSFRCNPFRGDVFGLMCYKRRPEQNAQAGLVAAGPTVQRVVDLALGRPRRSGPLNWSEGPRRRTSACIRHNASLKAHNSRRIVSGPSCQRTREFAEARIEHGATSACHSSPGRARLCPREADTPTRSALDFRTASAEASVTACSQALHG